VASRGNPPTWLGLRRSFLHRRILLSEHLTAQRVDRLSLRLQLRFFRLLIAELEGRGEPVLLAITVLYDLGVVLLVVEPEDVGAGFTFFSDGFVVFILGWAENVARSAARGPKHLAGIAAVGVESGEGDGRVGHTVSRYLGIDQIEQCIKWKWVSIRGRSCGLSFTSTAT